MASGNKSLGIFHLDGIAPAPRGIPQIEVTFDIDANGIVSVSAKDLGTQKQQSITITSSTNMSKDDIEKAVKDAEKYADEDKKRREEVEAKNQADSLVYQTDKLLKDMEGKISDSEKNDITEKQAAVKKALEGGNIEEIKGKTAELEGALHTVTQKMYEQAAQAQQASGQGADQGQSQGQPNADGVVDADFKDVE